MNTITLFFIFIPILVVILLIANLLLAVHRPDSEKVTSYECGYATIYGQTRNPFQISFYIVGILFLILDLEILIIYPYASCAYNLQSYGFWIVIVFFLVLTVGFVYEFASGALYFTDKRSSITNVTIKSNSNTPFYINNKGHTRAYSTQTCITIGTNKKENNTKCFRKINEPDVGQFTENPHIVAKRHIASADLTTAASIKMVQPINPITDKGLEKLLSIDPISLRVSDDIKDNCAIIEDTVGKVPNRSDTSSRITGVYVFTNTDTNDQLVGSSTNLAVRLRDYFQASIIENSKRNFFKYLRKTSYSHFKLDIYIIRKGYVPVDFIMVQQETLALEQYYVFTLNSTLNTTIKAVAAGPQYVPNVERNLAISQARCKPIYMFVDNILIYQAPSIASLIINTGISGKTITRAMRNK